MITRNLTYFLSAEALINIGSRCAALATSWWALNTPDPVFNLSIIITIPTIVGLVTLPLLSPLGDFFSKKKVMLLAYTFCFIAALGLAVLGFFEVFNLIAITFLLCVITVCHAIVSPVFSSGLIDVADEHEVQDAFRFERIFSSITMMLAPVLGVLMIAIGSIYFALAVDCFALFGAILLIAALKMRPRSSSVAPTQQKRWLALVMDGFKVKFIVKIELYWGIVVALLNFLVTPFLTFTLPLYLKQDLGKGVEYLGLNQSFFCIGMLLGSIWILKLLNKRLTKDKVCMLGVFSVGCLMMLVSRVAAPWPEVIPLLMMLIGISIVIHNINGDTYKMLALPAEFRARVSAVNGLMSRLIVPAGTYIAGIAVLNYPAHHYILFSGLAIIAMVPCMLMIPGFQRFLRLPESEVEEVYLQLYPKLKKMMDK